ncbi:MAG: hypothetical protein SF172_12975 [Burkholderiales bacterium]|nr:hypothetical protein [Burkholderiales bacterium]
MPRHDAESGKASIRRVLFALASAIACTSPLTASAVHLSPDHTGQVILVPFYTVRSGFVTSLSVVNQNMNHAKAIKVRFREALIGAPVMDFNVFLGPRDVWAASISDDGTGARINRADGSCTIPALPASGLPFVNAYYTGQVAGTFDDGGGRSLDRTREGYIEIFELGVVADGSDASATPHTQNGRQLVTAVTPRSTGLPPGCHALSDLTSSLATGDLRTPTGEITASAILIQTGTGSEFVIPPTALQRFFVPSNTDDDLYAPPGSLYPDLSSVSPARSDVVTTGRDGPVMLTVLDWVAAGGKSVDAVSAVLMKSGISAQYDVSSGLARSELVVTMPTMRHYVLPEADAQRPFSIARGPFSEPFRSRSNGQVPDDSAACSPLYSLASDREGGPYAVVTGVQFLPPTGAPAPLVDVCRTASKLVIVPNGSTMPVQHVLGVTAGTVSLVLPANGIAGAAPSYQSGWVALMPTTKTGAQSGPGQTISAGSNALTTRPVLVTSKQPSSGLGNIAPEHVDGVTRRYRGLPMIGFVAIQAIGGGQGYGGMFRLQGSPNPAP